MGILDKLKAAGSVKLSTLAESTFFNDKEFVPTAIHSINVAFSGMIEGGMVAGLTVLAGPSKHYKSSMGLVMVKAYMDKYPDAVCLFYDSEFGITPEYIKTFGIDGERVLHIPLEHIEQLKFDIVKRLEQCTKDDHVIILIDSVGNLASKKEVEDAMEEKSVADMTRAKQLKSFFRIMTPHLTMKNIPCLAINHIYMEQGMFPKAIVSGGTGVVYSANQISIIGRSQEKDGTEITGWNFTLNVEKSRFVREKSKLPIKVTYEGGIDPYSGIMEWAIESGHIIKSGSRYQVVDPATGEIGEKKIWGKDLGPAEFDPIIADPKFREFIKQKFMLTARPQLDDIEVELEEDEA